MTELRVRPALPTDADFLVDMLMAAANWAPGRDMSRAQVLADPALAHYVDGWMKPDDLGVVAVSDGRIGAAWLRYLTAAGPGYGYVSDDVPELSIGVLSSWRGRGVGRTLLRALLDAARNRGVRAVSLSVERANRAARLYASEGFEVVESFADADTMIVRLA